MVENAPNNELNKRAIRKLARAARRSLDSSEQLVAAQNLSRMVQRNRYLMNAQTIACYLADDGEPDLMMAMELLHSLGKTIVLPVIYPGRRSFCRFAKWTPDVKMVKGKFDIDIPQSGFAGGVKAEWVDVILMPLVAFDAAGNRLGRGGGFYDRSLAFLRHRQYWKKPKLLGVAHQCQQVASVPMDEWDMPTDGIIVV